MADLENGSVDQLESKKELPLEKKVELHSMEHSKDEQPEDEEIQKILKNKNEILNEKKRAQMELKKYKEELEAMKSALARQEQEKLEEKQEYKALWERTQQELQNEREARSKMQQDLVNAQKRKAFDKEIGKSLSKDQYYKFINFDDIIIEEDGSINSESVRYAVSVFRENYRELVPQQSTPRVGSEAPSNDGVIRPRKTLNDMSARERSALKKRALLGG